jgi:capsular exopolysaccharide synthesis family protein
MVAALQPFSPAAEQFRTLRTRIAQVESTGQRRVILVTSPGDGDGKTVTVANLALTMAQEFQRQVLLIDADLRNARLHECLGIPREPGLSDVLAGRTSLEDALVSLSEYRVIALPAGAPHGRPTELLSSEPMRRLVENLGRRFDRVVIDSTAAHFADAGVLEPLVDGVLLIVRAGRTSRPAVARALGLVPRAKLLGLVLNDSRTSSR